MKITLVPLQTTSRIASIRAYGCYMSSLIAMLANKNNYQFTQGDIERIFKDAVRLGAIKDNDLPTDGSKGDWFRCFVSDPAKLLKIAAEYINAKVNPIEVYRKSAKNDKDKPEAEFYIYEYKTRYGSHFLATDKEGNLYNPDPNIGLISLKSIRGWNL